MPPITSDALVLRTYDFGETSRVAVLLTRERGKLRAVVKGARSPRSRYRSSLEPLSEVRVGLYGRQGAELLRMGECELLHSAFRAGEQGLGPAMALSYFAELLDAFCPEAEAEDAVYRLARAAIEAVEKGADAAALTAYVEAWVLKLHGIYPPLDACAACGQGLGDEERRYHAPAHGFACGACGPATGPTLGAPTRRFLGRIFREGPAAMSQAPPDPNALESFHHQLISQHLERELRSYKVLRSVAREARA